MKNYTIVLFEPINYNIPHIDIVRSTIYELLKTKLDKISNLFITKNEIGICVEFSSLTADILEEIEQLIDIKKILNLE